MMSASHHTPAPWGPYLTSQPYIIEGGTQKPTIVACLPLCDEWEANARLICAAPDLLAVLQEAVNKGYMWDHDSDLWSKAKAAITKAKG